MHTITLRLKRLIEMRSFRKNNYLKDSKRNSKFSRKQVNIT